jgi:hypothetical protein
VLCRTHITSIQKNGPNQTAINELKYVSRKEIRDETVRVEALKQGAPLREISILNENLAIFIARKKTDLREQIFQTSRAHREEIERTGVDPDEPARERARQRRELQLARARIQMEFRRAHMRAAEAEEGWGVRAGGGQQVVVDHAQRGLRDFVADPQNVHTTEAVRQTKEIVNLIRKIPVPVDYQWHAVNASKTPFEIGMHCNLSQKAAWQMMSQYAQETAIYEIEVGIYGKVLDSVWQYVKKSSDRDDLCKIIGRELEDNIGMCAQGNLSRICNVLAGYLEGVGPQESLSERLGRLLGPLSSIEDEVERIRQACLILKENGVPPNDWLTWAEPLLDEYAEIFELIKEQMVTA